METLIRQNNYYHCEKSKYKSKSSKWLKIHIGKVHNNHIDDQTTQLEIITENCLVSCEAVTFDLCQKDLNSKLKLKVHKVKWHTKVAPEYGNITRLLHREQ